MKILYDHQIFHHQKFGGINRYFVEIMKIREQGIDVIRISPDLFKPEPVEVKKDLFSKGVRFAKRRLGLQEKAAARILPPPEVSAIFAKADYDIFHPTFFDPYFLELNRKPFVLTIYDMIHEIFKEYFMVDDQTSHNKLKLCHQASQIIAISEKTKEDLITIFSIPEEKVHAIPLASDFDQVTPQKPAGVEELEKYILFVGNRWQYKNFYFPVLALTDILKSDPELQLLCTGHPFSQWELRFFHDQGIAHQLRHVYLQNDQELAWAYQNAALFIFPSLYEGFGFPLLEAFASNCPVISSNGGSLPEVAGDAALYFEPRNFRQIQQAAHTALYDTGVRESLIQKGAERFKLFSWQRCRQQTMDVYKNAKGLS